MRSDKTYRKYRVIAGIAVLLVAGAVATSVFSANIPTSVLVGNSAPVVSAVAITSSTITLTAATTTNVFVQATITDNNGCTDINPGTTTILLYRIGYTSSTCLTGGQNSLDCYLATAFTASSTCSATSINTTTTFAVQYFARATDSSSSFSGSGWKATVIFKDPSNATGSAESGSSVVSTLNAINVTTSSINYGTVGANSDTGSTNQTATTTNAGNSSTTLQLSILATLWNGSVAIPTATSQAATTTAFTFSLTTSTFITATPATVSGFFLTAPTSTTNIAKATFWGLGVPSGQATGTYTGTNVFGALFQP